MALLRAQASRLIFLYRPRFSLRRLACRCRPAGGGRNRGIRNCFGKLNDPGKQGLRRLGILPQQLRTSPLFAPSITFRIWTLLHTGVESHLAGVALVTLAVLAIAVLSAALGLRLLL